MAKFGRRFNFIFLSKLTNFTGFLTETPSMESEDKLHVLKYILLWVKDLE
jgi:hypothetical protein